ncbi:MAG: TIGR02679 domain-containing protein [Erysipelotrichaceae bacterium]|nr:TIGR02679 domain-containing protein [Erysipelotrichaceae bacterium]
MDECIQYFKQVSFKRFIHAWTLKYQSLGHLGGKIVLNDLTSDEQEALGLLLGLDLSEGTLNITYSKFMKVWKQTKFGDIDFLDVLKQLQAQPLFSNNELKVMKQQTLVKFKQDILDTYKDTMAYDWLSYYLNSDHLVNKQILDNPDYDSLLCHVCDALNHLPINQNRYESLAIFSQNITKNPHYFDDGNAKELLLKGIEYLFNIDFNRSVEGMNETLYKAGIYKDDLSNYCYICHIQPIVIHPAWKAFYDLYEPWNVNLYNILHIDGYFPKMNIIILENPSVFRNLCDFIKEYQLHIGLICSNGQLNFSTYLLLDKLDDSQCNLYYAGDFDPEGLLIADKLKQRYHHLKLWCYDENYLYRYGIKQDKIASKRQKILLNIKDDTLQKISKTIFKTNMFAYQEGFIEEYQKSLMNFS